MVDCGDSLRPRPPTCSPYWRGSTHMFRIASITAIFVIGLLAGCSATPQAAPVAANIRKSLDEAGLKNVSVTQDRDKGVVTLSGHVAADADKANANQIAKS